MANDLKNIFSTCHVRLLGDKYRAIKLIGLGKKFLSKLVTEMSFNNLSVLGRPPVLLPDGSTIQVSMCHGTANIILYAPFAVGKVVKKTEEVLEHAYILVRMWGRTGFEGGFRDMFGNVIEPGTPEYIEIYNLLSPNIPPRKDMCIVYDIVQREVVISPVEYNSPVIAKFFEDNKEVITKPLYDTRYGGTNSMGSNLAEVTIPSTPSAESIAITAYQNSLPAGVFPANWSDIPPPVPKSITDYPHAGSAEVSSPATITFLLSDEEVCNDCVTVENQAPLVKRIKEWRFTNRLVLASWWDYYATNMSAASGYNAFKVGSDYSGDLNISEAWKGLSTVIYYEPMYMRLEALNDSEDENGNPPITCYQVIKETGRKDFKTWTLFPHEDGITLGTVTYLTRYKWVVGMTGYVFKTPIGLLGEFRYGGFIGEDWWTSVDGNVYGAMSGSYSAEEGIRHGTRIGEAYTHSTDGHCAVYDVPKDSLYKPSESEILPYKTLVYPLPTETNKKQSIMTQIFSVQMRKQITISAGNSFYTAIPSNGSFAAFDADMNLIDEADVDETKEKMKEFQKHGMAVIAASDLYENASVADPRKQKADLTLSLAIADLWLAIYPLEYMATLPPLNGIYPVNDTRLAYCPFYAVDIHHFEPKEKGEE